MATDAAGLPAVRAGPAGECRGAAGLVRTAQN